MRQEDDNPDAEPGDRGGPAGAPHLLCPGPHKPGTGKYLAQTMQLELKIVFPLHTDCCSKQHKQHIIPCPGGAAPGVRPHGPGAGAGDWAHVLGGHRLALGPRHPGPLSSAVFPRRARLVTQVMPRHGGLPGPGRQNGSR